MKHRLERFLKGIVITINLNLNKKENRGYIPRRKIQIGLNNKYINKGKKEQNKI